MVTGVAILLEPLLEYVMFADAERRFVAESRVGRLATVSSDGEPHVVPICHAFDDDRIVTAVDEKPKNVPPMGLKRVRNIRANPLVSLVFDRYNADWDELGWVRVTGPAELVDPEANAHQSGIAALKEKYQQYERQTLSDALLISIDPQRVRSWGTLDTPPTG